MASQYVRASWTRLQSLVVLRPISRARMTEAEEKPCHGREQDGKVTGETRTEDLGRANLHDVCDAQRYTRRHLPGARSGNHPPLSLSS